MALSRRNFIRMLAALAALVSPPLPAFGAAKSRASKRSDNDFSRLLAETLAGASWTETDRITLEVPYLAENGAIVPLSVESSLPNTSRILIFVEKNPTPLVAQFRFQPGADGFASLRLKMNETSPILIIAESEGRFFGTQKLVKVMIGGCG
ncbi:putative secreted protein [Methylocaldum marinum]|uniref:Putative secreted protein n=1 Tax=Methylocaldum marinum TaxID=1432792 RepID=A0A250L044_9GAMM|nr:thiosulfate oxidation carrier protein SoxY [Methylocaldum marinum]BBA37212.1 putative secreted protein [Methylocaldum marinum]